MRTTSFSRQASKLALSILSLSLFVLIGLFTRANPAEAYRLEQTLDNTQKAIAIESHGGFLWIIQKSWGGDVAELFKVSPTNGQVVQTFDNVIYQPDKMYSDGTYLWISGRDQVVRFNPANGASNAFTLTDSNPGIVFSGGHAFFVKDAGASSGTLVRVNSAGAANEYNIPNLKTNLLAANAQGIWTTYVHSPTQSTRELHFMLINTSGAVVRDVNVYAWPSSGNAIDPVPFKLLGNGNNVWFLHPRSAQFPENLQNSISVFRGTDNTLPVFNIPTVGEHRLGRDPDMIVYSGKLVVMWMVEIPYPSEPEGYTMQFDIWNPNTLAPEGTQQLPEMYYAPITSQYIYSIGKDLVTVLGSDLWSSTTDGSTQAAGIGKLFRYSPLDPITLQITAGPFAAPSVTTANIQWTTNLPSDSTVRYGTSPGGYGLEQYVGTNETNHSVVLTNLTPGTTYYYIVGSCTTTQCIWSTEGQFMTQSNQLPNIAITFPSNGQQIDQSAVHVTGTASDPDGTITSVQVRKCNPTCGSYANADNDSGNWSTWSEDIQLTNIGTAEIWAKATDNNGATREVMVTVERIPAPVPDYTFELVSESPLTRQVGQDAAYTFRVTALNGFNQAVYFTLDQRDGIPSGNFSWSRPNVVPDADGEDVTLTVTTGNLNPSGSPFNMRAKASLSSGANPKYANFDLILQNGPDFTSDAPVPSVNILQGETIVLDVRSTETVPTYDYDILATTDSVTRPSGGNPAHMTVTYQQNPTTAIPHGTGIIRTRIDTASNITTGTWVVKVKLAGQDDPLNRVHYVDLTINIGQEPDYQMTATPPTQNGDLGGQVTYTLNLKESIPDYTWPVAVTLDQVWGNDSGNQAAKITTTSLPQNITPGDIGGSGTNYNVVIRIAADTPTDTYTLTFKGVGTDPATQTHFATVQLVLEESNLDFEVYHTQQPVYLPIPRGTYKIWDVRVKSLNGFSEPVRTTIEDFWPADQSRWDKIDATFVDCGDPACEHEMIFTPPANGEVPANVIVRPRADAECGFYHVTARGRDDQVVGPPDTSHGVLVKFEVTGCNTDTEPPIINTADISCSPGVDRITVNWTTNEPANGTLFYGTTNPPANSRAENRGYVTSHSVTVTGLNQNTLYYYQVQSCDEAGNCSNRVPVPPGTCQTTEFEDNEPPIVVWVEPVDGQTVSGTVPMRVSATDNIGIQDVQFLVDGALISTDTAPPGCTPHYCYTTWDTTLYSDGNHSLTATARDTAGNLGSSTITVTVSNDSSGPVCSNLRYVVGATTADITWETSESSDSRVYYCREGTAGEPETCGNCGDDGYCANGQRGPGCYYCHVEPDNRSVTLHQITLQNLQSGSPYHFMAESCDSAGNCGQCGG